MSVTSLLSRSLEKINALIPLHIGIQTPETTKREMILKQNICIKEAEKLQVLDGLAFLLFTLKLLKGQIHDQFIHPILATKKVHPSSNFNKAGDSFLHRRHTSIPELIQIVIENSIQYRPCTMAHHRSLLGYYGVKRMYTSIKKTYYWPQMAAFLISTVHDFVHCAKLGLFALAS